MRILAAMVLLAMASGAVAQGVRGVPEQSQAKKPDLTAGGGNSSVGASQPVLPEDRKERFEVLDLDGDGRLSLAEAAGHADVVTHFDRADRNRDGKLSLAEYRNLGKKAEAKGKKKGPRRSSATGRTAPPGASSAGTSSASKP